VTTANDATPSVLNTMPTWLISQTSVHAHRLLSAELVVVNSNGYQYRLLAALDEFGPSSQAALGRRTCIDRSDVVAALNDLAGRGMVQRSPDRRTAAGTSSPSPPLEPNSSGCSTACWPAFRTGCSPSSHPPSANN
jgi:MarR family